MVYKTHHSMVIPKGKKYPFKNVQLINEHVFDYTFEIKICVLNEFESNNFLYKLRPRIWAHSELKFNICFIILSYV